MHSIPLKLSILRAVAAAGAAAAAAGRLLYLCCVTLVCQGQNKPPKGGSKHFIHPKLMQSASQCESFFACMLLCMSPWRPGLMSKLLHEHVSEGCHHGMPTPAS